MKPPSLGGLIRLGLIVLWGSFLLAQQQATGLDGVVWKRMKQENKYYFLTGYFAGLNKALEIINLNVENQRQQEFGFTEPFYVNQMRQKIRAYLPAGHLLEIDKIIEALNLFYADRFNLKIPVEVALRVVLARAQGNNEQADLILQAARRATFNR
jgi:hypothetical protein